MLTPPLAEEEGPLFHTGLELFNRGDWFEAHEVWEDVWRLASGPRKLFYQGLIQCAVALEHLRRGNPRGALNVLRSAKVRFHGLPAVFLGIDIPRLLGDLEDFVAPIRALPRERLEPGSGRGQRLPIDLRHAPRIVLLSDPFAH